jgi:hypothetical protein
MPATIAAAPMPNSSPSRSPDVPPPPVAGAPAGILRFAGIVTCVEWTGLGVGFGFGFGVGFAGVVVRPGLAACPVAEAVDRPAVDCEAVDREAVDCEALAEWLVRGVVAAAE